MKNIIFEAAEQVEFVIEAYKEFVLKDVFMNRMVIDLKSRGHSMEEALEATFNSCVLEDCFAETEYMSFLKEWRSKQ